MPWSIHQQRGGFLSFSRLAESGLGKCPLSFWKSASAKQWPSLGVRLTGGMPSLKERLKRLSSFMLTIWIRRLLSWRFGRRYPIVGQDLLPEGARVLIVFSSVPSAYGLRMVLCMVHLWCWTLRLSCVVHLPIVATEISSWTAVKSAGSVQGTIREVGMKYSYTTTIRAAALLQPIACSATKY